MTTLTIDEMLADLPDDPIGIAAVLRDVGIRGVVASSSHCPLAMYFQRRLMLVGQFDAEVFVASRTVVYPKRYTTTDKQVKFMGEDRAAMRFVRMFDHGYHQELRGVPHTGLCPLDNVPLVREPTRTTDHWSCGEHTFRNTGTDYTLVSSP